MQLKHSINSYLAISIVLLVGIFATMIVLKAITATPFTSVSTTDSFTS